MKTRGTKCLTENYIRFAYIELTCMKLIQILVTIPRLSFLFHNFMLMKNSIMSLFSLYFGILPPLHPCIILLSMRIAKTRKNNLMFDFIFCDLKVQCSRILFKIIEPPPRYLEFGCYVQRPLQGPKNHFGPPFSLGFTLK